MKKYQLLPHDTKQIDGRTLYRIQAVRDFASIATGTLGGYIESEHNLQHFGTSWVFDEACVYGDAIVMDDACVYGQSIVKDNAFVGEHAAVYGQSVVGKHAFVCESGAVYNATIESTVVKGYDRVY